MQMLGTWLVAFQAIRLDGGRCFKGVHLSQVHQQSYQVPNKTVKCTYFLLLLSGKTNNVVKDGLKAQQSHSPGQRPGY